MTIDSIIRPSFSNSKELDHLYRSLSLSRILIILKQSRKFPLFLDLDYTLYRCFTISFLLKMPLFLLLHLNWRMPLRLCVSFAGDG